MAKPWVPTEQRPAPRASSMARGAQSPPLLRPLLPSFALPARAQPVNRDSGCFVSGSRSSSKGRKAPCLGVAALILLCVCERKEDDGARRTDPVPMPIPFPSHPASRASPCPATKGRLPSRQTNQAFKFNSCPLPRRFKAIRRLIKAHVLLCWLGGKFLRRAHEINSGDQHGGCSSPCPPLLLLSPCQTRR